MLTVLPIITPPFVIGLAIILLFGRSGDGDAGLGSLIGIEAGRWIYGLPGLWFAQMLAFTPIAFLVLIGVVEGVSPSMEEAAQTLRADAWTTFTTVSLPLMRPGLANAFLLGFIESLADFGNPLVLGGNFDVLSTEIFFAIVGAQHDQGRAAVLAIMLLAFTLAAFWAQQRWLGRKQLHDGHRQGRCRHPAAAAEGGAGAVLRHGAALGGADRDHLCHDHRSAGWSSPGAATTRRRCATTSTPSASPPASTGWSGPARPGTASSRRCRSRPSRRCRRPRSAC